MSSSESSNEEEEKPGFVRLSPQGTAAYKDLQYSAIKNFCFWVFVGNFGGFTMASMLSILPSSRKKGPGNMSSGGVRLRSKFYAYGITAVLLSYHGYKVTRLNFIREKKKLLAKPENVLMKQTDLTKEDLK